MPGALSYPFSTPPHLPFRGIGDYGGIAHVLLSHRDDVADADRWAERYGARGWIGEADANAAPYATDVTVGDGVTVVSPGVV